MGKITLVLPTDLKDFIFRYIEDDEQVKNYMVVNSLPAAKEALTNRLKFLLNEVDNLKLRDLNT